MRWRRRPAPTRRNGSPKIIGEAEAALVKHETDRLTQAVDKLEALVEVLEQQRRDDERGH